MKTPVLVATIAVLASSVVAGTLTQNPAQTRDAFEVVSVKASGPPPPGARVGGGPGPVGPCTAGPIQIDPARFAAGRVTTLRLITWAYGVRDCRPEIGLVSGGPSWIRSEPFDIQGVLPEGTPSNSLQQLTNGEALKLQAMLQTMLIDRFKLTLRRETVEIRVLNLVVARPGKMQPAREQSSLRPRGAPPRGTLLMSNGVFQGTSIPMSMLVTVLQARLENFVVDKTGLTGLFDIRIPVELEPSALVMPPDAIPQVLDGLGLRVESGRAPVQVLVIDRVEKPTED